MGVMGYGGKFVERDQARLLRGQAWTLQEIADELGVSKSSVSVWVRDVEFVAKPRNRGHADQRPHPLHLRKLQEIERCRTEADELFKVLTRRERDLFALGLYAGEGEKTDGRVSMANTNPAFLRVFVEWLREEFAVDGARLRVRLYLHVGLDLDAANEFWSEALDIPIVQFHRPYRASPDATRRRAKHVLGCATVSYSCALTHRRVMARIEAVTSLFDLPG